ncbi:MAG: UDPGP type 1 family protein, partial [Verrucomicrobiota bacterium]
MPTATEIRAHYEQAGQSQVFRYFDELSALDQRTLVEQASEIDLSELHNLVDTLVSSKGGDPSGEKWAPAPYISLPTKEGKEDQWEKAFARGEEALSAGKVAAFTVAGGQGTRLGYDGPKGTFPVTPVTGASLFQVFAEKIQAARQRYQSSIPWLIMTSPINHESTVSFFEKHEYFHLPKEEVRFFSQGFMPAVDAQGNILLQDKGQIAISPDGHGGSLRALVRSGCVDFLKERGIDLISYFQVDNPLVRCLDPAFLGFHLLGQSELTSKACLKAYPEEKVGVFATSEGKTQVLEYSDLPDELAHRRDASGELAFRAGSIAIHIFSRSLVERLGKATSMDATSLPFHLAHKKVPFLSESGELIRPETPNGYKFEMFVFDALPFAANPLVIETAREDDFSPVKNAEGIDSPSSAKADQLRQY